MPLDKTLDLTSGDQLTATLELFRDQVRPDLDRIVELFPEYTPHNEQHIQNLLGLKKMVLAETPISELTPLEEFILDAAIWAHDWGMAVSKTEAEAIQCGEAESFEAEHAKLRQYIFDIGWSDVSDINQYFAANPFKWAEYVRQTHHLRSGKRIRNWFAPHNADLGDAVALAAEGHGFDFRRLEDESVFSPQKPVHGQSVNLQALAVYLRLIDLLDICKNRTPYELWQLVKPKNERSAMEWRKHAAMRAPVRLEEPEPPTWIRLIAEPEDADVLAELNDLKCWCIEEFERGKRLLQSKSPSRFHYDLDHIDFQVQPKYGLHSTPVRFSFDRQRTLELLGDEVYGSDPFVFLRELVQNALDATKTRLETLWLRPDLREQVGGAARLIGKGVVCWLHVFRGLLLARPIRMFGEGRAVPAGRTK